VWFLWLASLLLGCKSNESASTGSESTEASEDTVSGAREADAPASNETPSSTEDQFLAEMAQFAEILRSDASPSETLQRIEAHVEKHRDRIDDAVTALNAKRAGMTAEARQSFEDGLSGRPEVSDFFEALDSFQSKATTEQMDSLDQLFSDILPEE